ncbi:alpha/beta fold hydrolase [Aureibacter tunicatorum]|uniref:Pimeloyl-ACP methyl ester carboxylesterase n=1 Tax=Aureibacter tunicatorum TaxID=866807 RepID=A0AAE3XNE9_9BACT|nr:alpha/beta hydrolase [Aureibacter tunicatorum]MDR6239677.1 pimeloyl-ACP methyl ester carboxylesterase [Aureibacter tunicatorum]BDD04153.1 alpha/beta hydrolase [Aureibacter tunicatorum]
MTNQLNFTIAGKGKPILFLHGFCESLEVWKYLEPYISTKEQFIAIDLPGFGKSPLPKFHSDHEFSLVDVADIIADFIKNELEEPPLVIGHSLGGYITLALAEQHPQLISGFALYQSTSLADSEEKKEIRDKAVKFVQERGMEMLMPTFIPSLFAQENKERLKTDILEIIKTAQETSKETYIAYSIAMKNRNDYSNVLRNFSNTKAIIAGEHDPIIPIATSDHLASISTNIIYHKLKNTGHMGMIESPEASSKIILNLTK